jgi:hypothetical protein
MIFGSPVRSINRSVTETRISASATQFQCKSARANPDVRYTRVRIVPFIGLKGIAKISDGRAQP